MAGERRGEVFRLPTWSQLRSFMLALRNGLLNCFYDVAGADAGRIHKLIRRS
jgi:hypothetical protein